MTVDLRDAAAVEETVDLLLAHTPELTTALFARLMAAIPGLTTGRASSSELECLLMSLLGMVTSELRNPHRIVPCLRGLAANHLGKDFTDRQLRVVRDALVCSIRQCLAARFDSSVEAAWGRVTEVLILLLLEESIEITGADVSALREEALPGGMAC